MVKKNFWQMAIFFLHCFLKCDKSGLANGDPPPPRARRRRGDTEKSGLARKAVGWSRFKSSDGEGAGIPEARALGRRLDQGAKHRFLGSHGPSAMAGFTGSRKP